MSSQHRNTSDHQQQHGTTSQETHRKGVTTRSRSGQKPEKTDSDSAQSSKGTPQILLKTDSKPSSAKSKDLTKPESTFSDKSGSHPADDEKQTESESGSALDTSETSNASTGSKSTEGHTRPEKASRSCASENDQTTPGSNPVDKDNSPFGSSPSRDKDQASSGSNPVNKDSTPFGSSPSRNKDQASPGSNPVNKDNSPFGSSPSEDKDQASSGSRSTPKGDSAFKEIVKFYRQNRILLMSTVAVGGLSGAIGIFVGAFMYKTMVGNMSAPVIIKDGGTTSWDAFKAQLQETEKRIREEYDKRLKSEMDHFNLTYTKEMTLKTQALVQTAVEKELDDAKSDITSDYDAKLLALDGRNNKTIEKATCDLEKTLSQKMEAKKTETLDEMKSNTLSLKDQVDQRLLLEPAVMDMHGFMKFDVYGPFILILPLLEILAVWVCCHIFARKNTVTRHREGGAVQNGDAVRPRQEANRLEPIRTDNRNIALVCFRHDDEVIVNQWGDELLQRCHAPAPRKRVLVIESLDDVRAIPPCRAALVFADPDEREMILEDERHHIGQGLRRQAVQRMLDSGVEVFVIVYHDKNKNDLSSGQLYNRKLGQIGEHAQLKRLKSASRVISMKNSFKPWQTDHIVGQIDDIFSNR